MIDRNHVMQLIKTTVMDSYPSAKVMLYGSYARGDYNEESDLDILVLLEKDKISYNDKSKITFPLFMLGVKLGIDISPIVLSKNYWENKHRVTPFYENVNMDGIVL